MTELTRMMLCGVGIPSIIDQLCSLRAAKIMNKIFSVEARLLSNKSMASVLPLCAGLEGREANSYAMHEVPR